MSVIVKVSRFISNLFKVREVIVPYLMFYLFLFSCYVLFCEYSLIAYSYKFLLTCLHFCDQPQSKNGVDSFGGLGATLVDSLDTLFIMGLDEQFQRARE